MGKTVNKYSLDVAGLLGVAFVVLKLTDQIAWSWWWVTAPFWGAFSLVCFIPVLLGIVFVFVSLWSYLTTKKETRRRFKEHAKRYDDRGFPKSKFRNRLDQALEEAREKQKTKNQ